MSILHCRGLVWHVENLTGSAIGKPVKVCTKENALALQKKNQAEEPQQGFWADYERAAWLDGTGIQSARNYRTIRNTSNTKCRGVWEREGERECVRACVRACVWETAWERMGTYQWQPSCDLFRPPSQQPSASGWQLEGESFPLPYVTW